jgi:hypothetical protein
VSQWESRSPAQPRRYRAGEQIEDVCRACQADRMHAVMVVDGNGRPLRVVCGFCGSEHNYRGGPRDGGGSRDVPQREGVRPTSVLPPRAVPRAPVIAEDPLPLVSERERVAPPISAPDVVSGETSDQSMDLELLLRRVIREESGLTPTVPADKWRGGELVLRPGKPGVQEKTWPIDTFFHKIVMIRNRLRTLEQQLNASDLPEDAKVKLQTYITGCYGTLTSFNVLFADEDDQFKGSSTD